MITHIVPFALKHEADSKAEKDFLIALQALSAIPGVLNFATKREVSPKNEYRFAVSMSFVDGQAYANYNAHPDHVAFVNNRWLSEVCLFVEIDLEG